MYTLKKIQVTGVLVLPRPRLVDSFKQCLSSLEGGVLYSVNTVYLIY